MKKDIMRALLGVVVLAVLGCTPTLNWREVRDPDGHWTALFPGKPAQLTRVLEVPGATGEPLSGVTLSLWSTRVSDQTFTIGRAAAPGVSPERLRTALVQARLANIRAALPDGSAEDRPIDAHGQMRLDPKAEPVQARLTMRTVVAGDQVLEAIVAGPASSFDEEAAETFLRSARLGPP
jgi:hypothetical protein